MTDDLERRADNYETRFSNAGSTEGIIDGLVKGAKRSQRMIRLLSITLLIDIVLSAALGVLGVIAWRNSNNIADNAQDACEQTNMNSVRINQFIDALSDATLKVGAGNNQAIIDRVKTYQASKAAIHKC